MGIVFLPCGYQWFLETIATSHHDITKLITYRDARYPGSALGRVIGFPWIPRPEISAGAGDTQIADAAARLDTQKPLQRRDQAPEQLGKSDSSFRCGTLAAVPEPVGNRVSAVPAKILLGDFHAGRRLPALVFGDVKQML